MADIANLKSRLLSRMPGRTDSELGSWLLESSIEHGFTSVSEVPAEKETQVMLYAKYIGLQAKAAETAENAALGFKGINVNKSGASGNYNAQIQQAWKDYKRAGGTLSSGRSTMLSMARPDGR